MVITIEIMIIREGSKEKYIQSRRVNEKDNRSKKEEQRRKKRKRRDKDTWNKTGRGKKGKRGEEKEGKEGGNERKWRNIEWGVTK